MLFTGVFLDYAHRGTEITIIKGNVEKPCSKEKTAATISLKEPLKRSNNFYIPIPQWGSFF